jgi:hypothetical protein
LHNAEAGELYDAGYELLSAAGRRFVNDDTGESRLEVPSIQHVIQYARENWPVRKVEE